MPKSQWVAAAFVAVCLSALALASSVGAQAQSEEGASPIYPTTTPSAQQLHKLYKKISNKRRATWRWEELMLESHTGLSSRLDHSSMDVDYLKKRVRVWHNRLKRAKKRALNLPHKWLWLCIHHQEGSWTDNASNNPHWGGLQMGEWFMWHYASKLRAKLGRANNWPPLMQMWVAERAYQREGYSRSWLLGQWVPTASRCI